jgi:hypothetical protein
VSLSAFADQVNQSSDASGTTLQFVFNNGIVPLGFHGPSSTTLVSGQLLVGGSAGNNLWFGSDSTASVFNAAAGASGDGNDILVGGATSEAMHTGNGWNFVDGGAGNDFITSGSGNDILHGGRGYDFLAGGAGNDLQNLEVIGGDLLMKRAHQSSISRLHPARNRRVKARGFVRGAGWRRAQPASASMPCISQKVRLIGHSLHKRAISKTTRISRMT